MPPNPSFTAQVDLLAEETPLLLERLLRTGGWFADLFYEHTTHHRLRLRQQARHVAVDPPFQETDRRIVEGLGLRVLGEQHVGVATTEALSSSALVAAAEDAAAQLGHEGAARTARPLTRRSMHLAVPADAPDTIAASEKDALVRAAADAAFSLDARIRRVEVAYHDRVRRIAVATSEGALRAEASTMVGLRVDVTLAADGSLTTAHAVAGGAYGFGHFFEHPPEEVAREAVERACRLAGARPIRSGTRPVVLAGGWGGVWLHEAVGHLLEADVVAAGNSPFDGYLGRPVAAPTLTLVDDATWPGGRGSYAFDDEATPSGRTTLIENGVLRGFLTDRCFAYKLGLPHTGNARRQDYRHAPSPRMTNLLLLGGDTDPTDLIADVDDGLYVSVVGHGVVQPGQGFACDVLEGYRIERGRLTAPVTGARLVGLGPEVLGDIVGIGKDVQVDTARGLCQKAGQVVPVSVGMPTVLIRAMEVEGL